MEKWRAIPGWSQYMVSNLGRVKRLDGMDALGRYKVIGRILKPVLVKQGSSGYKSLRVSLSRRGRVKSFRVANLVLLVFVGPPPPDENCALHNDDCQLNNKLSNLQWGSHAQNGADRKRNDLSCYGERNGNSRLTEVDAKAVLREFRGESGHGKVGRIAKKLSLPYGAVWNITQRRTWKHLEL